MKHLISQFVKFGIVGAINTLLNLVIYWICIHIGLHYLLANLIGFIITVALSYVLNNLFTFKEERAEKKWSIRVLLKVYISYFTTGMVINSGLLWFWNDFIGLNENISPILNLFVTIPLNFVLNKLWAYKKKPDEKAKEGINEHKDS